jgi:hypothetical protein
MPNDLTAPEKTTEREMLLVASKAKTALQAFDVQVAGDALDALNALVYWHIEQAAKRAQENGRKTVRGHDFIIIPR